MNLFERAVLSPAFSNGVVTGVIVVLIFQLLKLRRAQALFFRSQKAINDMMDARLRQIEIGVKPEGGVKPEVAKE